MVINNQKWHVRKFLVQYLRFKAVVLIFKLTLVIKEKLNILDWLFPILVEGLFPTKTRFFNASNARDVHNYENIVWHYIFDLPSLILKPLNEWFKLNVSFSVVHNFYSWIADISWNHVLLSLSFPHVAFVFCISKVKRGCLSCQP